MEAYALQCLSRVREHDELSAAEEAKQDTEHRVHLAFASLVISLNLSLLLARVARRAGLNYLICAIESTLFH